jgi:hypothetical protein
MRELANVQKGISFVYYGLYLIVAAILVAFLTPFFVLALGPLALILLAAVPFMIVGGTVLGLVGRIMCLSVPDDFRAAGVIYVAVISDVSVVVISAATWVVDVPEGISALTPLLGLAATIFFLVFLKKLAAYINDSKSQQRAGSVLNILIATFVTGIVGLILPPLLLVVLVLIFVGFILYVLLLMGLMESLKAVPE